MNDGDPILRLPATALDAVPDALAELHGGRRLALIVEGAFPLADLAAVVRRMDGGTLLPGRPCPHYTGGRMFGRVLAHERDIEAYFAEATAFLEESPHLFVGSGGFLPTLGRFLSRLSGGRPVEVARDARGRPYQAFSVREMLPGAAIGLHYENEAFDSPSMGQLLGGLTGPQQLSAYLPLSLPEGGGELCVYDLRPEHPHFSALKSRDRLDAATHAELAAISRAHVLDAKPGDLLVFDAGRHYHWVERVRGTKPRWTMGTFLGRTRDGERFVYFA